MTAGVVYQFELIQVDIQQGITRIIIPGMSDDFVKMFFKREAIV